MEAKKIIIRVPKEDIQYVTGIFDGHARMAVPRTIDKKESILELIASPFYVDDIYEVLESLKGEGIDIKVIDKYEGEID
ncbi:MAG: DUF4911 domain-containing protein [Nitrospinota bacterium]|nr:DUF4911 domain-containing protein [Nitrospinota bacterium]